MRKFVKFRVILIGEWTVVPAKQALKDQGLLVEDGVTEPNEEGVVVQKYTMEPACLETKCTKNSYHAAGHPSHCWILSCFKGIKRELAPWRLRYTLCWRERRTTNPYCNRGRIHRSKWGWGQAFLFFSSHRNLLPVLPEWFQVYSCYHTLNWHWRPSPCATTTQLDSFCYVRKSEGDGSEDDTAESDFSGHGVHGHASSIVVLARMDGRWRFCIDYWKLNSVTKMDVFQLPWTNDFLDLLVASRHPDISRWQWRKHHKRRLLSLDIPASSISS